MMKTEPVWNYVKAFKSAPVEGLTWGQLFNLAPRLRAGCAFGMVMERGSERKRRVVKGVPAGSAEVEVHSVQPYLDKPIPEPTGEVHNFYTDGAVILRKSGTLKVKNIFKIMLDGGAVVNLIPHGVAARLDLHLMRNDDLKIRTATGEVVLISYYVTFDVRIAGVMAMVWAYVVPAVTSYMLLLGRQWLRQVRAKGDYEKEMYFIKDAAGHEREVPRSAFDHQITSVKADMFRVEVNEEKVILDLELTQEEIEDFEDYYMRQGNAYLREVIQQSSATQLTTDEYTSGSDEFSTTETETEDSEASSTFLGKGEK